MRTQYDIWNKLLLKRLEFTEIDFESLLTVVVEQCQSNNDCIDFLHGLSYPHSSYDSHGHLSDIGQYLGKVFKNITFTLFINILNTDIKLLDRFFTCLRGFYATDAIIQALEEYECRQDYSTAKILALSILRHSNDGQKQIIDTASFKMAMMIFDGKITLQDNIATPDINQTDADKAITAYQFLLGNDLPEAKDLLATLDQLFAECIYNAQAVWTIKSSVYLKDFYQNPQNVLVPLERFSGLWQQCIRKQADLYRAMQEDLYRFEHNQQPTGKTEVSQWAASQQTFWSALKPSTAAPITTAGEPVASSSFVQEPKPDSSRKPDMN